MLEQKTQDGSWRVINVDAGPRHHKVNSSQIAPYYGFFRSAAKDIGREVATPVPPSTTHISMMTIWMES
jgi:hypothetical protein